MSEEDTCPFCLLPQERIVRATKHAVAFYDGFPVSQGHALVIPVRHVASFSELSDEECTGLWRLVRQFRAELLAEFTPDGFNVGMNDGQAAGQTVMHAHVHLIPRYDGDVLDPRGGLRWVIPDKADYWTGR